MCPPEPTRPSLGCAIFAPGRQSDISSILPFFHTPRYPDPKAGPDGLEMFECKAQKKGKTEAYSLYARVCPFCSNAAIGHL